MKTTLAILLFCVFICGCVGRHYVHYGLDQSAVNKIDFECRYRAEMMSHGYRNPLISALDFAENFDRCMRANGFVTQ